MAKYTDPKGAKKGTSPHPGTTHEEKDEMNAATGAEKNYSQQNQGDTQHKGQKVVRVSASDSGRRQLNAKQTQARIMRNKRAMLFSSTAPGTSPMLTPRRTKIIQAMRAMESLGFSQGPMRKRTNMLAHDALCGFGCTMVESFDQKSNQFSRNFSLVATQTAEIKFRDEQQVTPDVATSSPSPRVSEAFPDSTDPFYELDDPRSQNAATMDFIEKQLKMPDLIRTASDISLLHIRNRNSKYLNSVTKPIWRKDII
jgi:hypothetical protein